MDLQYEQGPDGVAALQETAKKYSEQQKSVTKQMETTSKHLHCEHHTHCESVRGHSARALALVRSSSTSLNLILSCILNSSSSSSSVL